MPSASKAGSQKNGTPPASKVTLRAEMRLVPSPDQDSTSVMVARSAPIERCGSKNSLIETRAPSTSNCRAEYCRSSRARAMSGIPVRSLVRSTPSTMVAWFRSKS